LLQANSLFACSEWQIAACKCLSHLPPPASTLPFRANAGWRGSGCSERSLVQAETQWPLLLPRARLGGWEISPASSQSRHLLGRCQPQLIGQSQPQCVAVNEGGICHNPSRFIRPLNAVESHSDCSDWGDSFAPANGRNVAGESAKGGSKSQPLKEDGVTKCQIPGTSLK
jgi:hypothetical protein